MALAGRETAAPASDRFAPVSRPASATKPSLASPGGPASGGRSSAARTSARTPMCAGNRRGGGDDVSDGDIDGDFDSDGVGRRIC